VNVLQKDEWGFDHLMVDSFDRVLFVDDVSGNRPRTRNGQAGLLSLRVLFTSGVVSDHNGDFVLGAKEIQYLHSMCAEILAKLSAEALR
jgi:hypothetical protein